MFEEKAARENMFGYQEVHNANWQGYELPDPYLMKLLTGRKKDKGLQLLKELDNEVAKVVAQTEALLASSTLPVSLIDNSVEYGVDLIKPEFRDEVFQNQEKLKKAAMLGFCLGRLDGNRIGENPAVALGAHKKALGELCKMYFADDGDEMTPTRAACINIIQVSFYASRRFGLQI
jgi:hypothetical protein